MRGQEEVVKRIQSRWVYLERDFRAAHICSTNAHIRSTHIHLTHTASHNHSTHRLTHIPIPGHTYTRKLLLQVNGEL